ncbi:MAG: hypothetical protein AB7O96_02955 [Pseudobdellovibrionaceae bacterium]
MRFSVFLFMLFGLCACGVKGKPLPPLTPTEIGRGEPTYQGATKTKSSPALQKYSDDEDWPETSEPWDDDEDPYLQKSSKKRQRK